MALRPQPSAHLIEGHGSPLFSLTRAPPSKPLTPIEANSFDSSSSDDILMRPQGAFK